YRLSSEPAGRRFFNSRARAWPMPPAAPRTATFMINSMFKRRFKVVSCCGPNLNGSPHKKQSDNSCNHGFCEPINRRRIKMGGNAKNQRRSTDFPHLYLPQRGRSTEFRPGMPGLADHTSETQ